MKRTLVFVIAVALMGIALSGGVSAASWTGEFPSASSTVVASVGHLGGGGMGYFWSVSRGDMVGETFTGTGLAYVDGLDLIFEVTENVLYPGWAVDWDVKVNGTPVGGWSWADADGTGTVNLSFAFAPIADGGTFTIEMIVVNEVPDGDGSIALGYGGRATLRGGVVPEPSSFAALAGGLIPLLILRRRRA